MRILLTGSGGLLGATLRRTLESDDLVAAAHTDLDVADPVAVADIVGKFRPEVVVNAAAMAGPDAVAADPDAGYRVNTLGPRVLASASAEVGAALCHVSTDYVFGGKGTAPYDEWDEPAPVNVYGVTKLAGENEVRRANSAHYVVRTSWIFGPEGGAAVKVLRELEESGEVRAWVDQWNVPTPVEDLARTIRSLVATERFGTYHVAGSGKVNRYEWSRMVLEAAGADPDLVVPTQMADSKLASPRPTDTELDVRALRISGLPVPGDWRPALHRAVFGRAH